MKLKNIVSYAYLLFLISITTINCKKGSSGDTMGIITNTVDKISCSSANCGGNVTLASNDGGGPITAKGVVWSTNSLPTISLSTKTIDGTGSGYFYSTITGLFPLTIYYVRAYATNSIGTFYGPEMNFKTTEITIGQNYAGGIVAYLLLAGDQGYSPTIKHGIIAAPQDLTNSNTTKWWNINNTVTGATGSAIGSGSSNTTAIIKSEGGNPAIYSAARLCSGCTYGGYTDWYLPSKDELNVMLLNIGQLPYGFCNVCYYWSSTEKDISNAWYQSGSVQVSGPKNLGWWVRPIRSF